MVNVLSFEKFATMLLNGEYDTLEIYRDNKLVKGLEGVGITETEINLNFEDFTEIVSEKEIKTMYLLVLESERFLTMGY